VHNKKECDASARTIGSDSDSASPVAAGHPTLTLACHPSRSHAAARVEQHRPFAALLPSRPLAPPVRRLLTQWRFNFFFLFFSDFDSKSLHHQLFDKHVEKLY
jgi:hypothetical protein